MFILPFEIKTKEPMFTPSDGTTVRILIDSDNNQNTGYYYPGIGADHLVEVYGEDTGLVSSAMLYGFDNSRGKDDWNGFFSLTSIKANSTKVLRAFLQQLSFKLLILTLVLMPVMD